MFYFCHRTILYAGLYTINALFSEAVVYCRGEADRGSVDLMSTFTVKPTSRRDFVGRPI